MAEHSRSSGVFSRRRVEDVCCRPPARPRRYPVQSSLSGEREMTPRDRPLCRATVGGPLSRPPNPHIGVCKSGALPKNWRQPRPVTAYAAETTTSLSPCSLSARQNVSVQVWSGTGVHLANYFFAQPSALFVAAPTTTTAGPLSPPFLQPSKMSVSANYFFLSS